MSHPIGITLALAPSPPTPTTAPRARRRRHAGHAGIRDPVPQVGRPLEVGRRRRPGPSRSAIGLDDEAGDHRPRPPQAALAEKADGGSEPLWVVLIGHGSFDGKEAKFNLRGPDVTDAEFAALARADQAAGRRDRLHLGQRPVPRTGSRGRAAWSSPRPGAATSRTSPGSASTSPSRSPTPAPTSTRTARSRSSKPILTAGARTAEFYKTRSRLATEHALLDDNGDHLGTPADWFHGVRAIRRAKDGAPPDGLRAHQLPLVPSDRERAIPPEVRQKRNQLELAIAALRDRKGQLAEDDYYARLEPLMVELARLYRDLPARPRAK